MQSRIDLSYWQRVTILIGLLIAGLVVLLFVGPFPQDLNYHNLADSRQFLGFPNFNDVVSNAGFALIGVLGLVAVAGVRRHTLCGCRPGESGVCLVSLGTLQRKPVVGSSAHVGRVHGICFRHCC